MLVNHQSGAKNKNGIGKRSAKETLLGTENISTMCHMSDVRAEDIVDLNY